MNKQDEYLYNKIRETRNKMTYDEEVNKKTSLFVIAFIKVAVIIISSLGLIYFLVNYLKL